MIAANDDAPTSSPPSEEDLELMAYLDGELDPSSVAPVEARLGADTAYAAQLARTIALSDFVRGDAPRVYSAAGVDAVADRVMTRLHAPPASEVIPPTSRLARQRKNTVIWVAFGSVAAAAAALVVYVRGQEAGQTAATTGQTPSTGETVAVKAPPPPPPRHASPPAVVEQGVVIVEDLEVGEGATVIYTRGGGGAAMPVVWVNDKQGAR